MKIQCEKCGRQMDLWEVLGYVEFNFLGALQPFLVQFFIEAAKNYLSIKDKGFIDGPMASFANSSKIKCSKCESIERWSPVPEKITNQVIPIQVSPQETVSSQVNPGQEKSNQVGPKEEAQQIKS